MNDEKRNDDRPMTPAQRRLTEDCFAVYPPEAAESLLKNEKEKYMQKLKQRKLRRQTNGGDDAKTGEV